MKSTFRKFSYVVDKFKRKRMGERRYFLNESPDFDESLVDVANIIPFSFLQQKIHYFVKKIEKHFKPNEKNAADGIYLGTAGVAYMYYRLAKVPLLKEEQSKYIASSLDYLKPALEVALKNSTHKHDIPSFILGNCGIYAVAAAIFKLVGNIVESENYRLLYLDAAKTCKKMDFLSYGSDELFVGRAGYVLGALWMAKETNTSIVEKDLFDICSVLVQSGRKFSKNFRSPSPLMYSYYDVQYLGAAHGICSILQALLCVPGYLATHPSEVRDVKNSVDYLLGLQDTSGNFPCDVQEVGHPSTLVHWCHGAPGMIYLMAKAYLIFGDAKYLKSCIKMGDLIWEKGLLKKGPGICHGVAGNGYAFMLLYRLTGELKYLYRAIMFARFLDDERFLNESRTPDNPFSLYEGVAGTVCYFGDITTPSEACFPFSDIFP